MTKYLVTTVDTNDADYVNHIACIDNINSKDLELIQKLIELVKNNKKRHNFVIPAYDGLTSEQSAYSKYGEELGLTEQQFYNIIGEYFPNRETDGYYGYHTLKDVYIVELVENLM